MGHNSKIGYPYLPAREPWRGRDVLQRAWRATPADDPGGETLAETLAGDPGRDVAFWRATLAGTADDPDGTADDRLQTLVKRELGGRPWRGRRTTLRTTLAGTALWHSQKELGGRPWRGRRTTLTGTADDRLQTLVKRAWRVTLAGTADDPGGAHSLKQLGGRPGGAGGRTTLTKTADDGTRGTGGHLQNQLGGQIWRGRLWLWQGQLHGGHGGRLWQWTARTPARTTLVL